MKTNFIAGVSFLAIIAVISACDPHVPPSISFSTGGDYVSMDTTVAPGVDLLVGIIGKKREDDMKRLNVSYSYDGGPSASKISFPISGSSQKNYQQDYTIEVRDEPGVEKWFFAITDRDGNIAKLTLTVTVEIK
jgi:hypothetical protein